MRWGLMFCLVCPGTYVDKEADLCFYRFLIVAIFTANYATRNIMALLYGG